MIYLSVLSKQAQITDKYVGQAVPESTYVNRSDTADSGNYPAIICHVEIPTEYGTSARAAGSFRTNCYRSRALKRWDNATIIIHLMATM